MATIIETNDATYVCHGPVTILSTEDREYEARVDQSVEALRSWIADVGDDVAVVAMAHVLGEDYEIEGQ